MTTSKLFASDFEDELYRSMEATLIKNQSENVHGSDKLALATDLLNTASCIFEKAGMTKEAEEVVSILEKLVQDIK